MKQNLGKLDRIFRFILGIWIIRSPEVLLHVRYFEWGSLTLLAIGVIALLESFVGWCCLHDWLRINNKNQ